ncbi:MAG TPA: lipocalin-like domain-containing protein [Casimicrobiaceae bacterium]|nr:lipocalin-like domain-containing protein [Casimicrobiaceae bacterium]
MRRRLFLASPLALYASGAISSDDYPRVVPGRALEFPRDAGAHPAYRSEWWYVTAWLRDAGGRRFGAQVTFFRNRPRVAESNPSAFAPRQLLFAHAALADPRLGRLRIDQRAARAGFGLAGASEQTTDVWIDDWSLKLEGETYVATIAAREFRFALRFAAVQPVLPEGERGFSRKSADPANASYYYSQPQLVVSGNVAADGADMQVAGTAWLDHEWSSEALAADAAGWDWIGINLDDGGALMAFRMRDRSDAPIWAGGTERDAGGRLQSFGPGDIGFNPQRRWRSPRTGIDYPVAMQVDIGGRVYDLLPLIDDQELDSRASTGAVYWEGAVRALRGGREAGRGYLELTGYGKPLRF